MKLSSFTPPFLQKLDKYLLLHQPALWATRVHHLVFWAGAWLFFMWGMGRVFPVSLKHIPQFDEMLVYALIPTAIITLFWAYQVTLYKVETHYGERLATVKQLAIYGLGVTMLGVSPILFSYQVQSRISTLKTPTEITNDIMALNLGSVYCPQSPEDLSYMRYPSSREGDFPIPYSESSYYPEENSPYRTDRMRKLCHETYIKERNNKQKREERIAAFVHTYNSYQSDRYDYINESPEELSLKYEKLLEGKSIYDVAATTDEAAEQTTKLHEEEAIAMNSYHNYEINRKIELIRDAKTEMTNKGAKKAGLAYLNFLGIACIALLTLIHTNLRTFLLAAVYVFGAAMMSGLACSIFFRNGDFEKGMQLFFYLIWIGSVGISLISQASAFFRQFQQMVLVAATVTIPGLFLFADMHSSEWEALGRVSIGLFVTIIVWIFILRKRFHKLCAAPLAT